MAHTMPYRDVFAHRHFTIATRGSTCVAEYPYCDTRIHADATIMVGVLLTGTLLVGTLRLSGEKLPPHYPAFI